MTPSMQIEHLMHKWDHRRRHARTEIIPGVENQDEWIIACDAAWLALDEARKVLAGDSEETTR